MKLAHFYHVYADGRWREPLSEHLHAVERSGLLDVTGSVRVSIVGSDAHAGEVEQFLEGKCATVVSRTEDGWEQETLELVRNWASTEDGAVLYAHTKGAANHSTINVRWRRSMTYHCVVKWAECLQSLADHDAVGCHWLTAEDGTGYFGGTFWWANTSYLRRLAPISYHSRWMAELWIGQIVDGAANIRDMNPGAPSHQLFTSQWEYE